MKPVSLLRNKSQITYNTQDITYGTNEKIGMFLAALSLFR